MMRLFVLPHIRQHVPNKKNTLISQSKATAKAEFDTSAVSRKFRGLPNFRQSPFAAYSLNKSLFHPGSTQVLFVSMSIIPSLLTKISCRLSGSGRVVFHRFIFQLPPFICFFRCCSAPPDGISILQALSAYADNDKRFSENVPLPDLPHLSHLWN